jgi:membrane fusion protein, heavy metal efflux system
MLATAAFITRDRWIVLEQIGAQADGGKNLPAEEAQVLKLSPQARQNLGLISRPVTVQTYWRTIQVPGVVVDRPGLSDRGVTAPAVVVVAKVHAFPGETVQPGDRLFTLRIISEYLQNAQAELFKTIRDRELVQEQRDLLKPAAQSGAVAGAKLIELDNQLRRLNAAAQSYRQDLLTRGLSQANLESVAAGKFIAEIEVVAPPPADRHKLVAGSASTPHLASAAAPAYEVQELKVELGQQVQAGQLLCLLANHRHLFIEGHCFRREAPLLEEAAQKAWPVRVEFAEDGDQRWPALPEEFRIHHLANTVDPGKRTFAFYLPLTNPARSYERDGKTFLVWRFRPGQRVRLYVPVEELKDVLVVPAAAVVRDGPEAYVFRQNGDLFERRPVHVLYEDRLHIVLANDGSVPPGIYVAQSAAASLNRVLKAQHASGGLPPGFHVHPDGTVHGTH